MVSTLALGTYAIGSVEPGPQIAIAIGLLLLPYLSALVLPMLLIHSFSAEWNGQTHYQLLSLPVARMWPALAKIAANLSLAAAVFITNTAALHATYERLRSMSGPGSVSDIDAADGWVVLASVYWSVVLLLTGFACLAAVVKQLATRFKGLAVAGVFLFGFWFYGKLHGPVVAALQGSVGRLSLRTFEGLGSMATSDAHLTLLYSIVVGSLFTAAGLVLLERRVEA